MSYASRFESSACFLTYTVPILPLSTRYAESQEQLKFFLKPTNGETRKFRLHSTLGKNGANIEGRGPPGSAFAVAYFEVEGA